MEQIKALFRVELCNLYGMNVFRHMKDKNEKKKRIALAATIGVVFVILMCYVGGLCYGLIMLKAADIIPAYLVAISSIITIVFGIFKAGGVIFRNKGYDIMSSLPLSDWAVVLSRLIRLYIESLTISLLVMIPGILVYGWFVRPLMAFYLIGVLSVFIIPFIPVAIATGVGALITGVSSRMKHKSLVEAVISVGIVVAVMLGTSTFSDKVNGITPEMLTELTGIITSILKKIYPPAIILGNAIAEGDFVKFMICVVISVAIFAIVVAIVSLNFHVICRRLYATSAKHDYKMESLRANSVVKTLVQREAKRYFSSGVYVTNTIMGPVLGTVFSVSLFFIDMEEVVSSVPVSLNAEVAIPFLLGGIFGMMNPAAVSISMEGKEWWIVKSIPLTTKDILDGKILFNLCLVAPFYVVSVIVAAIALKSDIIEVVWLVLIPALIIVFSSVFGITVNLKLPKMDWDAEVSVVKQSASAMLGGIGAFFVTVIFMFCVMLMPAGYSDYVNLVSCVVIVTVTISLYRKNNRVDLKRI